MLASHGGWTGWWGLDFGGITIHSLLLTELPRCVLIEGRVVELGDCTGVLAIVMMGFSIGTCLCFYRHFAAEGIHYSVSEYTPDMDWNRRLSQSHCVITLCLIRSKVVYPLCSVLGRMNNLVSLGLERFPDSDGQFTTMSSDSQSYMDYTGKLPHHTRYPSMIGTRKQHPMTTRISSVLVYATFIMSSPKLLVLMTGKKDKSNKI
jgi:hypothetical protein